MHICSMGYFYTHRLKHTYTHTDSLSPSETHPHARAHTHTHTHTHNTHTFLRNAEYIKNQLLPEWCPLPCGTASHCWNTYKHTAVHEKCKHTCTNTHKHKHTSLNALLHCTDYCQIPQRCTDFFHFNYQSNLFVYCLSNRILLFPLL